MRRRTRSSSCGLGGVAPLMKEQEERPVDGAALEVGADEPEDGPQDRLGEPQTLLKRV